MPPPRKRSIWSTLSIETSDAVSNQKADEDEAALRISMRCIGEALINLAGRAS